MNVKRALIADAVLLVVYAISANPAVTSIPVHECLGVAALIVVIVHTVMHVDHLVEVFKTGPARHGMRFAKAILDIALVFAFMLCCVSGLMVSATVFQFFGTFATGYYFWNPLHAVSAKVLLALLVVHIAANWKVIAVAFRKKDVE